MVAYHYSVPHECFMNKDHLHSMQFEKEEFAPLRWDRLLQKNATKFPHRSIEWCNDLARTLGDMSTESREALVEEKAIEAPFKIVLNSPLVMERRREQRTVKPFDPEVSKRKINAIKKKRPYDIKKEVLANLASSNQTTQMALPMPCSKLVLVHNNRIDIFDTSEFSNTIFLMTDQQFKSFQASVKEEKQKDALETANRRKAAEQEMKGSEQIIEGRSRFIQKEKLLNIRKDRKEEVRIFKLHQETFLREINEILGFLMSRNNTSNSRTKNQTREVLSCLPSSLRYGEVIGVVKLRQIRPETPPISPH